MFLSKIKSIALHLVTLARNKNYVQFYLDIVIKTLLLVSINVHIICD